MESSQVVGVSSGQKYGDTESGWTMYIGSQICNEEDGDNDNDCDGINNENKPTCRGDYDNNDDNDEESDDSMASDASSGPIEPMIPSVIKEEIEVFGGFIRNTTLNAQQGKCFSANNSKKPCKQVKKTRDERRVRKSETKNEHDNTETKADSAESQV